MPEIIIPKSPNGITRIECEEEEVELMKWYCNHITHSYDVGMGIIGHHSVKYAKGCVEDFEWVNSHLGYPLEFVRKGAVVFIVRKGSEEYEHLDDIPNTTTGVQLFILRVFGSEALRIIRKPASFYLKRRVK